MSQYKFIIDMDIQQTQNKSKPTPIPVSNPTDPSTSLLQQNMMLGINSTNTPQALYHPQIALKQRVKCLIEGDNEKIEFCGWLVISDQSYVFQFELGQGGGSQYGQKDVELEVQFRVTETVGTNKGMLVVFVNSDKNYQGDTDGQQPQQQRHSDSDQVINLIKKQRKGNFFLRGQCTLTVQFLQNTKQNQQIIGSQSPLQKAYSLLSLYIGQQDEGNSQYQQDQDMEQMISADDIDEDGNIIMRKGSDGEQEWQDDGEEGEDPEGGGQGGGEGQGKMEDV